MGKYIEYKEEEIEEKEEIPLKDIKISDRTRADIRKLKLIAAAFVGIPLFVFLVALFLLSLFN